MRGFWRWAYRTKRVPKHLADELPKVREQWGAPRPTPDYAWQAALAGTDARTTLMLRLAGEAGLRRGEVSRIHTRDLLEGGGGGAVGRARQGRQGTHGADQRLTGRVDPGLGAAGHTPGGAAAGWLFPNRTDGHLTAITSASLWRGRCPTGGRCTL